MSPKPRAITGAVRNYVLGIDDEPGGEDRYSRTQRRGARLNRRARRLAERLQLKSLRREAK